MIDHDFIDVLANKEKLLTIKQFIKQLIQNSEVNQWEFAEYLKCALGLQFEQFVNEYIADNIEHYARSYACYANIFAIKNLDGATCQNY